MTPRQALQKNWFKAHKHYPEMSWRKKYEWARVRTELDQKRISPKVKISHAVGYVETEWRFVRSFTR